MDGSGLEPAADAARIPLTVIGGYLGAGKTTLVNQLLRHPGGRRIGVVVNDFGTVGIDAALLAEAEWSGSGPIVSLPNGCVCCTIGSGLQEALAALLALDPPVDHIVVEVSGVADPASAAAWATVPPCEPGGVVVLAAADSVRSMARDRLVGTEVLRQLAGADLIVVTKCDLCAPAAVAEVERWLDETTGSTPRLAVEHGAIPAAVLLGVEPSGRPFGSVAIGSGTVGSGTVGEVGAPAHDHDGHTDRYVTWEWSGRPGATRAGLDAFLAALPTGVLRLKGFVTLDDGSTIVVQRVGDRSSIRPATRAPNEIDGALVAIALGDLVDPLTLTGLAHTHLQ